MSTYKGGRYKVKKTNVERFWSYVDKRGEDECWEWTGCKKGEYGAFWIRDTDYVNGGKMVPAHRYSYSLHYGDIPPKHIVHHICENKLCQNPKHLMLSASFGKHAVEHHPTSPTTINKLKTHCLRGHEFTPENTNIDNQGRRICKTCASMYIKKAQKLQIFKGKFKPRKKRT